MAAVAADGLGRVTSRTLSGESDWRAVHSSVHRQASIRGEQGAEERLCSEPTRRSVQNRIGGRRGRAGDLLERAKQQTGKAAALRLRVQCVSKRPSITRWQRALRERRGYGTGRLKHFRHWKCTEPTPLRFGVLDQWRETAGPSRCGTIWMRRHPAAAAESSCRNMPAISTPPSIVNIAA